MFYLKYVLKNAALALQLLRRGEWRRVWAALYARAYLGAYYLVFLVRAPFLRARTPVGPPATLKVNTDHPVAFSSPDHLVPHGTKYNNNTNRKFVLLMHEYFRRAFPQSRLGFMDLGCSGGQLVADFAALRWTAVGLEGSDYSLRHRRANWRHLAGKNLFTCDITQPFRVQRDQSDLRFHLITAWEVMEHIHPNDLDRLFANIREHLVEGGFFIASTSSSPSVIDGVELHQTRMSHAEWQAFIARRYGDLEPADLGLKIHQYVRFDFGEPSFLVYRKRAFSPEVVAGQKSAPARL